MKKWIITIIFFFLITPSAYAAFEKSERVTLKEVDAINRNAVVSRKNSKHDWLLYFDKQCRGLREGGTADLVIRGSLNGTHDYVKRSAIHRCPIRRAVKFNSKLHVNLVYNSNTEAIVTDKKDGQLYTIEYDSRCRGIAGFFKKDIYVFKYGKKLNKSDKIYLPRDAGQCPLLNVMEKRGVIQKETETEHKADTQVPSVVRRVRATPGNGKVFLYWKRANDNAGVDHYIVSISRYKLDTKKYAIDEMPNQIQTVKTHVIIEDLENDETYYFYVLAVDKNNNVSARWSASVQARPLASATKPAGVTSGLGINLRKTEETANSFLFEWDPHPLEIYHTVIFESGKRREFVFRKYSKNRIRILKLPRRRGKQLSVTVRAMGLYGKITQEKISFRF